MSLSAAFRISNNSGNRQPPVSYTCVIKKIKKNKKQKKKKSKKKLKKQKVFLTPLGLEPGTYSQLNFFFSIA